VNVGAGSGDILLWGITQYNTNAQINAYKSMYGVTNPCAGTEGGGVNAFNVITTGQTFYGTPTYCVVCPDRTLYFMVCFPPTIACFDPYFALCNPPPIPIDLEVTVFLEGPFNGVDMDANLIPNLPLNQPFNIDPWYYPGTESVALIPGSDIVDWVLVELRSAASAAQADIASVFDTQAAFLRSDGNIVDLFGDPMLHFDSSVSDSLFIVIHHRNHLPIMSAFGLEENDGLYSYDFTSNVGQAFGSASQKLISIGVWGMYGGNGEHDDVVDIKDKSPLWDIEAGFNGYLNSDYNLDGQSDNMDKDDFWTPNIGEASQVPN